MLAKIKDYFFSQLTLEDEKDRHCHLQLAATALLIELSRADHRCDPQEQQSIESALRKAFQLEEDRLKELITLAEAENREATSLYQFTSLIKDNYSLEQRYDLVKMLWEVALADGEISKYEDHLIRKIADLIYLPHSAFIRAKLEVVNR